MREAERVAEAMHQGEAVQALRHVGRVFAALEEIRAMPTKSILADCAYQGPPPKKWARERAPYYDGYNACLRDVQAVIDQALRSLQASA